MTENERRSRNLIARIGLTKDLDLRERAEAIRCEIASGDRKAILKWFNLLIDLNHAKLHGLGEEFYADRDGGWGFSKGDDNFLSSLRMKYLGHIYGIRPTPGPLSVKQVAALGNAISKPFYTMQLAMILPLAGTDRVPAQTEVAA